MSDLMLESGLWQARIAARAGGLIAALTQGGTPILRTMAEESADPLDAACFPMVPWCNRIADARFVWEGEPVELARNFLPEAHAIHGHGWHAAWDMVQAATDRCTLTYRHTAGQAGWPWAYDAQQQIALSPEGCSVSLTLINRSNRVMPAGAGLHPYVRRRDESRVRFAAARICEVGADMIPTGRMLDPDTFGDFAAHDGAALPAGLIDHCYAGWDGAARISDDFGTITLCARGPAYLHLYAPDQPDTLCLEPVSHLPDALGRTAPDMRLLQPGDSLTVIMMISAEPRR